MNGKDVNKTMNNSRLSKCGNSSREYECERPFKKARYMWQLKGKYYLKNEYQQQQNNNNINSNVQLATKHDKKFESMDFISKMPDNSKADICDSIENYNCISRTSIDRKKIPLSMVECNDNDDYLHKWQNKRIAESFVDNTINMILENWNISPFDASDLVENCTNGGQIEDEGILMAIQSHGLQSATGVQCQESDSNHALCQSTMDNYTNARNETINQQISNISMENDCKTDDSLDFLRTAVSVAIEKKGLSYTY